MRRLLPLLALLVFGGGALWALFGLPPRVRIVMASGIALEAVHGTGTVEPVHRTRVGPAIRGHAGAVMAQEGARVAEGQHLARTPTPVARDIGADATLERADARAARSVADAAVQGLGDYLVLRETPDAVLLPPAAVVLPAAPRNPGAAAFVWVVEKERVRRREVEVGVQAPRSTEIRRGLSVGEAVVLAPPAGLADGGAVRLAPP